MISRFSTSGHRLLRRFAFVSTFDIVGTSRLLDPSKTGVRLGHHPHPRKAVPTGGRLLRQDSNSVQSVRGLRRPRLRGLTEVVDMVDLPWSVIFC